MRVRYYSTSYSVGYTVHEHDLETYCENPSKKAKETLGKLVALLVRKGLITTKELLELYPLPYNCYGFELLSDDPTKE